MNTTDTPNEYQTSDQIEEGKMKREQLKEIMGQQSKEIMELGCDNAITRMKELRRFMGEACRILRNDTKIDSKQFFEFVYTIKSAILELSKLPMDRKFE